MLTRRSEPRALFHSRFRERMKKLQQRGPSRVLLLCSC
uniref:Uncharacterized protein n=1 Tax=Scleropages formosus TaxID=113540 RepID=A0A8C9SJL5_SCLFO